MAPVTSESAMVVTVVAGWGADDDDGETTCVTDGISEEKGCVYVRRASYEAAGPVRVRSASSSEVRNRKRMSRASYCASDGWVRRSSWSIVKRKRMRWTIEGVVGVGAPPRSRKRRNGGETRGAISACSAMVGGVASWKGDVHAYEVRAAACAYIAYICAITARNISAYTRCAT